MIKSGNVVGYLMDIFFHLCKLHNAAVESAEVVESARLSLKYIPTVRWLAQHALT